MLKHQSSRLRYGLILFLFFIIAYLFPFFENLSFSSKIISEITDDAEELNLALLRSTCFALIMSLILVAAGLFISILLIKISNHSSKIKYLTVLLIPVILGNVSSSFIFKILLENTTFFFQNAFVKFLGLGLMQIWQFGTLFIYLFWLNMQSIRSETWNYADTIQLKPLEKIKDIILPHQRNLVILLYVIGFIFCFYESSKIEFIFKASRGTHTELINHWLNRTYQSDSLLSPAFAFKHISQLGILVLFLALIIIFVSLFINNWIYNFTIISKRLYSGRKFQYSLRYSTWTLYGLVLFTFLPIIIALCKQIGTFHFYFSNLLYPLQLTVVASFVASFIAICFGIISRLAWMRTLADFNSNSMIFLILIFVLLIVPPIVVLVSGFKWMQIIGYDSDYTIAATWLVGHSILSFPLLASFAISTHFRVKNSKIDYLQVHSLTTWERLKDLFVIPFRADYILTFIIAFSLIWNESVVNSILSDLIPSFVTELNRTITGKAADYAMGLNYLLVSLLLAAISVLLWNVIISKSQANSKQIEITTI